MEYTLCKVLINEEDIELVDIMDGFDCMCKLMTKLEMIGDNLSMGEYAVLSYDYEEDTEDVELMFTVCEDGTVEIYE